MAYQLEETRLDKAFIELDDDDDDELEIDIDGFYLEATQEEEEEDQSQLSCPENQVHLETSLSTTYRPGSMVAWDMSNMYLRIDSSMMITHLADIDEDETTTPWLASTTIDEDAVASLTVSNEQQRSQQSSLAPSFETTTSETSTVHVSCCSNKLKRFVSKMAKKVININNKCKKQDAQGSQDTVSNQTSRPPVLQAHEAKARRTRTIVFAPRSSRFNATAQQQQISLLMANRRNFKVAGDIIQYYV